jgi:putative ABC transport system permease protein|tara:strand:+ start:7732 stop:8850 length:1119 start_codon:yes stop_codon:yes gene_type:complete
MLLEMVRSQLGRHKLRTGLTIASIFIGVFLLVTMVSFSEGIQVTLDEYVGSFAGIITITEGDGDGGSMDMMAMMSGEIDDSIIAEIEAMGDVDFAEGMSYTITDAGQVAGLNPRAWSMYGMDVGFQDGDMFDVDADNEIIVGSLLAKTGDYTVGDEIEIKSKKYEIVGVMETIGSAGDDASIYMPLKEAQWVSGKEDKVMAIMAKALNLEDTENVARQIMDEFDDINAMSDKEMLRQVDTMMGQINVMIYALGLISAIISGIVIMNVMFMSVNERTVEIGAMKALGATNKQVLTEIITESIVMSMIGGILAIFAAFLVATTLNTAMGSRMAAVTLRLVIGALIFSGFLGSLGGYIPARRAAKINPIEALRYE